MSKKIYGDLNVSRNTIVNSKNTIRDINNITADNTGEIPFPLYKKEEIDKITAALPVSRVGTMDYLPMSINGSYQGATTYFNKLILPVIIEDNGTLVYLRPGTNGNTDGYYYSYIPDVRTVADMQPVLTNEKYIPSFFTSNHKLLDFVGSKANELLFMKTNNGTVDTYSIGLTNGTMNLISHQYVEFPRSSLGTADPQYAHIVGSLIYIWCFNSYTLSDPFDISLYTISVDDVRNGVSTSLTHITGFSGSTIYGSSISSSNNIRIASKYVSTASSDNPFLLQESGINSILFALNSAGIIQAAGNDTGTSIRVAVFHPYSISTPTIAAQQNNWGISFTYNTSTKTYVLDNPSAGSIQVTSTGGNIIVSNPYNAQMENINGFSSVSQGNVPSIYQTEDGMVLSTVARYVTSSQHKITRANISNFIDHYTSLNLTTRELENITIKFVNPIYGSAVGENLINPTLISPTRLILSCSGTDSNGTFTFDNKVYTDLGTTRTYTYNSVISGTTLTGYAPQTNRVKIDNSDLRYTGMVTLIDSTGTMNVYGSSFIEGLSKPALGILDPNTLLFGNGYSLSNSAILTNLKNSILSSVSYAGVIQESSIVLYYVPDSTFSKSIAITSFYTNSTNNPGYCVVSEIDVTISSNIISALSASSNRISQVQSNVIVLNTLYINRMAGLVIAKYSDFTYVGIPALINFGTPSNATFRSALGKISNTTHLITSTNMTYLTSQYLSAGTNTYEVGAIPDVGFGVYENGNITDYQTKCVFKNFGTTSSQFDAMISDLSATPISRVVMTSQDVAQGFNVYFSQEIPVFLNGRYYTMPISSIDLTTIDPAPENKTFYLYITIVEGSAIYQLSTTLLSEELYRVYIGTITTGSSSISSINTEKVTRFLTYRPSTTQRGSAIPASTGVPSSTGTRWG